MIAPLCNVCDERHFGVVHVWKGAAPEAKPIALKVVARKQRAVNKAPVNRPDVNTAASLVSFTAPPEVKVEKYGDRKSYMRAYMAKRRAKS